MTDDDSTNTRWRCDTCGPVEDGDEDRQCATCDEYLEDDSARCSSCNRFVSVKAACRTCGYDLTDARGERRADKKRSAFYAAAERRGWHKCPDCGEELQQRPKGKLNKRGFDDFGPTVFEESTDSIAACYGCGSVWDRGEDPDKPEPLIDQGAPIASPNL